MERPRRTDWQNPGEAAENRSRKAPLLKCRVECVAVLCFLGVASHSTRLKCRLDCEERSFGRSNPEKPAPMAKRCRWAAIPGLRSERMSGCRQFPALVRAVDCASTAVSGTMPGWLPIGWIASSVSSCGLLTRQYCEGSFRGRILLSRLRRYTGGDRATLQ